MILGKVWAEIILSEYLWRHLKLWRLNTFAVLFLGKVEGELVLVAIVDRLAIALLPPLDLLLEVRQKAEKALRKAGYFKG